MTAATLKSDLKKIAESLPEDASYCDAMYEIYLRMKIAQGRQAAQDGDVISHDEVKKRFGK